MCLTLRPSFRNGSDAGGFLYATNSETEIDMEQVGNKADAVDCTNWHGLSNFQDTQVFGFDQTNTHDFKIVWQPSFVDWYVDGQLVVHHTQAVPSAPAYFPVQHLGHEQLILGRHGHDWTDTVHLHQQLQIHEVAQAPTERITNHVAQTPSSGQASNARRALDDVNIRHRSSGASLPPGGWDTRPYVCGGALSRIFSAKKLGCLVHNQLLLVFGHLRKHRQGQHMLAGFLRLRKLRRGDNRDWRRPAADEAVKDSRSR